MNTNTAGQGMIVRVTTGLILIKERSVWRLDPAAQKGHVESVRFLEVVEVRPQAPGARRKGKGTGFKKCFFPRIN